MEPDSETDRSKDTPAIEFIKRAKEAYRKDAKSMTWEEKIESVERMREASAEAKRAMQEWINNNAG